MKARVRHLFAALLLASGMAAAGGAQVPDTLAQRLAACSACHSRIDAHGAPVNDAFFPRLGGKPAGYLYHQLLNFRDGRRQVPLMAYLVSHLSDDYLREIAAHFAAQPPAALPARPVDATPQALAHGARLVREGDGARRIPACSACHGARLTGVQPFVPGLLGLPRDYLNAQFGAWRNGVRRAHAPDCMADIAGRLAPGDIAAISAWLSAQPLPPDAHAQQAATGPLPLACGSAPAPR